MLGGTNRVGDSRYQRPKAEKFAQKDECVRRETLGILGCLACFTVAGLTIYDATTLPSGDVLISWLSNISSGLVFVGLGAIYFGYKQRVDDWVKPDPFKQIKVRDSGQARDHVEVEGSVGISASAAVKASRAQKSKTERIVQIALAGFGGGGVILYVGASLLHLISTGYYLAIPVTAIALGGGLFLIIFSAVEIIMVLNAQPRG